MSTTTPVPEDGRPLVLRGGTVLTMDDARTVLDGGDVLVVDGKVAAVGTGLEVPEGTVEVDATGGVVMPGMVDTHRHMWQTAMRGYGADWTLTQYFVWYYLEHGRRFRPEDIGAGNALAAWEALDAGVTTTVDWSHGLQSVDHAEAAADALVGVPGRFVLAYGNIQAGPWEWTADKAVQGFLQRRRDEGRLGVQLAFDVTGDPAFPEKAAFEVARELGLPVSTHAGVWGATNDDGIRLMHDNGFADAGDRVRARRHALDRLLPPDRGLGRVGVGVDRVRAERRAGVPAHLAAAPARHPGVAVDGHQRVVERRPVLRDAHHPRRRPLARAPRGAHATATPSPRCTCGPSTSWPGRPAAARRRCGADDIGSLEVGKAADVVLLKNDASPVSFPVLNPYGHVAFQAQRGDVHTVLVGGRVVKHEGRLVGADLGAVRSAVESTVEHLRADMGEDVWQAGMNPDLPTDEVLDNPYQYTDYKSTATHEARGSMFG